MEPEKMQTVKNKKNEKKKVEFEYFAPEAKDVRVVGTFNEWKETGIVLKKNADGKWAITLDLRPGKYEYRYLVDGVWQNDQRPCKCVPNSFGTWNCILEV